MQTSLLLTRTAKLAFTWPPTALGRIALLVAWPQKATAAEGHGRRRPRPQKATAAEGHGRRRPGPQKATAAEGHGRRRITVPGGCPMTDRVSKD